MRQNNQGSVQMTEKRFELRLCNNGTYYLWNNSELTDIAFDKFNKESANGLVDLLNELHEENQRLKKAEILANQRGELIGFATSLIEDLGSQEMQEMWTKFREKKYKEWRYQND